MSDGYTNALGPRPQTLDPRLTLEELSELRAHAEDKVRTTDWPRPRQWLRLLEEHATSIALVDRLVTGLRRIEEDAHVSDFEGEDRCADDCPGCDAEELLREIGDL